MQEEITRQTFMELLRSGLWNRPSEGVSVPAVPDWNGIFRMAQKQAVWGLVADAINHLPTDVQPVPQDMQRLNYLLSRNRTRHALLNSTLTEAVTLLKSNGIHPILLKGQGVATYYADPALRICGDIDLYIGKENYRKSILVAKHWGEDDSVNTESVKHYHFSHQGVTVELHRFAEKLPFLLSDHHFQQWTGRMLQPENLRTVRIGNTEIQVPPADFEVLYIFNHAYHHFLSGGIGLRQLCDWTLALHHFHAQINLKELERNLKAFGLWRGWKVFGCIAVETLGLHETEFPFYNGSYKKQADTVLASIFEGGNFGFFSPTLTERPAGYVAGKWHTLKRTHHRLFRLFPLFPMVTTGVWAGYIFNGIRQVITDQLKKS